MFVVPERGKIEIHLITLQRFVRNSLSKPEDTHGCHSLRFLRSHLESSLETDPNFLFFPPCFSPCVSV